METNPACRQFWPKLSPYVDGELSLRERGELERHLTHCATCTHRVADLRATSGLLRLGLETQADEVDWNGFAQRVMARVTPEPLPFWERLQLEVSERWTHQRGLWMGGVAVAATAALLLMVGVPWVQRLSSPVGYGAARVAVREVTVDSRAHVAPVVMENAETGDAIIWLVDHEDAQAVPSSNSEDWGDESDEDAVRVPAPRPLSGERPTGGEL